MAQSSHNASFRFEGSALVMNSQLTLAYRGRPHSQKKNGDERASFNIMGIRNSKAMRQGSEDDGGSRPRTAVHHQTTASSSSMLMAMERLPKPGSYTEEPDSEIQSPKTRTARRQGTSTILRLQ